MECESYASFWNLKAEQGESARSGGDEAFEAVVQRSTGWNALRTRTALDLKGGQRVFELGVGGGRLGKQIAPHCRSWSGVEASASRLEVAIDRMRTLSEVELRPLEGTRIEGFSRRSFDRAYSVATLQHMDKEDVFLCLEGMADLLQRGGLLYLETWNLLDPIGWKRWRFEVTNWRRADQRKPKNPMRNQFCTADELELYLHEAGFKVLELWSDSPWLQVVAGFGLDVDQVQAERSRLREHAEAIVYSRQWSDLYGRTLDVVYGSTPPGELLAYLEDQRGDDEVVLFRDYLLAIWKQGEAYWGAPPERS